MAARVGKVFAIDPVSILNNQGDSFVTLVRIAAAQVVNEDERKSAEAQKSKSGGGRRGRRR